MRLILILKVIVLKSTTVSSQDLDSSLMILKAKVCLLEFLNYKSKTAIFEFIIEPLSYKLLNSKGFSKHIYFFEIPLSFLQKKNLIYIYDYSFILAYNARTETIYRLKGFRLNDFPKFLSDTKNGNNIDYYTASAKDLQSANKFAKSFFIEGLDMKCLYKSAISVTKHKLKFSCLRPAEEID